MANPVTWRTVDVTYGETGLNQEPRVETEYQVGFEVDGVFVPFTTVAQGRVDMLRAQAEAAQAKAQADKAAKKPAGNGS